MARWPPWNFFLKDEPPWKWIFWFRRRFGFLVKLSNPFWGIVEKRVFTNFHFPNYYHLGGWNIPRIEKIIALGGTIWALKAQFFPKFTCWIAWSQRERKSSVMLIVICYVVGSKLFLVPMQYLVIDNWVNKIYNGNFDKMITCLGR